MFIGHFAVGFAAKKFAPKTGLGWLILAPLFCDVLWPVFLLTGLEHARIAPGDTAVTPLDLYDFPWSHSLVMSAVWAVLFGVIYWRATSYRPGAIALGIGVFSHWILDVVSHRPDMPLWPGGGPKIGLGLWHSIAATIAVESLLFALAVWLYARATRPLDRIGRFAFRGYVLVMAALYAGNFGPPPPSITILAWASFSGLLLVLWPAWFDRHREIV
jgi:membrane-bound metal-dependent hydrolase YbcI (DUF457 family)